MTGRVVALAEERRVALEDLALADLQSIEARIGPEIYSVLSVDASVASRTSFGGTAPDGVRAQAKAGASGWRRKARESRADGVSTRRPGFTGSGGWKTGCRPR